MKKLLLITLFFAKFSSLIIAQTLPTLKMGEVYDFAVNDTFVYIDSIWTNINGFVQYTTLKKTLYVILSRNIITDSISYNMYIKTQTREIEVQRNYRQDTLTRKIEYNVLKVALNDSLTHQYKNCSFPNTWRGDNCFVRSLTTTQSTTYNPRKETIFVYTEKTSGGYPEHNYWYGSGLGLVRYSFYNTFNNPYYRLNRLVYYNKGGERWGDSTSLLFSSMTNLAYFNIHTAKSRINIQWQTTFEEAIDHFEIERSVDNTIWTTVLYKKATNKNDSYFYTVSDVHPISGNSYYRLKIVGSDNKVSYSDVKKVNDFIYPYIAKTLSMYPNPVNERLNIEIKDTRCAYKIIDILGNTILIGEFQDFSTISTSSLNTGMYIIELTNKETGIIETRHFVK